MDSVAWLGTNCTLRMRAFLNLKSWDYSGWLFRRKMCRHSGWETTRAEVEGGEVGFEAFLGSPTGRDLAHTLTFLLWLKQILQKERQSLRGLGMSGKKQPARQAQESNIPWPLFPGDFTGLERDQKAGGTQRLAGTLGPGAHLLVSTKGTSSSQESFITSNSTSILRQIQFCSH